MLVLSRKKNESIVIDDNITIVVVEIRGDKVRLGVEAPKEVPVHRREVFDAIRRNETAPKQESTPVELDPVADAKQFFERALVRLRMTLGKEDAAEFIREKLGIILPAKPDEPPNEGIDPIGSA